MDTDLRAEIDRVAARIQELRDLGVPILTQMLAAKGRRQATYLLQRKPTA